MSVELFLNVRLKHFEQVMCGILVVFLSAPPGFRASDQPKAPENAKWYRYDEPVMLTGILQKRWAYGPPGYGENPKEDKVVRYYSLQFKVPINMVGDTLKQWDYVEQRNVTEVELIGIDYMDMRRLSPYIGRKMTLKGMLYPRHFAHEFTDVLLEIIEDKGRKGIDFKSNWQRSPRRETGPMDSHRDNVKASE